MRTHKVLWRSCLVASTVLTVALILGFVRSFLILDDLYVNDGPESFRAISGHGRLMLYSETKLSGATGERPTGLSSRHLDGLPPGIGFLLRPGMGRVQTEYIRRYHLDVPYLYLIALTAIAPVIWLCRIPRRRRLNRLSRGHCLNCGYDLRRTPATCSECGFVVKEFPAAPSPRPGHATRVLPG